MVDYAALGTMIGIEIHQELDTGKLFCKCSSEMTEKKQTSEIQRKLRAVAGESGKTDVASQYEFLRDRNFIYHAYEGEACLVDTDSEPPHPVNEKALETALGFAKLTKLKVPEHICVMRKTVTDGSAISGFQRTMLAGIESEDSYLETSKGKVVINQLNLEEDACKIEKKDGNIIMYSLSRLGIPLLEIGTDPSIKDADHALEVASQLGMILRSFDTVKRGLGTIRQDVNVSIKGGARIEVKGWQDLKSLPQLVENEVLRQKVLLDIKDELKKRGVKKFDMHSIDATDIFKGSDNKIISSNMNKGGVAIALMLPSFAGLLKKEVCPGKTFGRELSEYAKAYGTKGMIHTDEDLARYGLEKEFSELLEMMKCNDKDLVIIVVEDQKIAKKAIESIYNRALYCLKGVPEETRIPNHKTATSSYARPLPGAHRLYPETDIPNIHVTKEHMDSVKIPELLTDKTDRLSKAYGIKKHIVKELIKDDIDIETLSKEYKKVKPEFIAQVYITYPKEIRKRYNAEIDIKKHAKTVLERLDKSKISKDAVHEILVELSKGNAVDFEKYKPMDDSVLRKMVKDIIDKNKGMPVNAMVGKVMGQLRGKAPGKQIVTLVKELCN